MDCRAPDRVRRPRSAHPYGPRQQQLDREVQGLKGDPLRALDQQQKTLESGQQAVRTQIESLDKRVEGKFGDVDKRWDTNFAQIDKRLDTQSTLLWSLLVWATGLVGTAFGLLWYRLGKIEDRLTALADRFLPPPSPGGQGSSGHAPEPPPAPSPVPSQPSGFVPGPGLGRTQRAIRLGDERT